MKALDWPWSPLKGTARRTRFLNFKILRKLNRNESTCGSPLPRIHLCAAILFKVGLAHSAKAVKCSDLHLCVQNPFIRLNTSGGVRLNDASWFSKKGGGGALHLLQHSNLHPRTTAAALYIIHPHV